MLRKFLLSLFSFAFAALGLAQTAAPIAPQTKPLAFAVVTVKPNHSSTGVGARFGSRFTPSGYSATNVTVQWMVLSDAYRTSWRYLDVTHAPSWLDQDRFDIEAKVADEDRETFQKATTEQKGVMLQALLAERFALHAHHETRSTSVFNLLVARGDPKLMETKPERFVHDPFGNVMPHGLKGGPGIMGVSAFNMGNLAAYLSNLPDVGRFVVDRTGLQGRYDFELHWTPDNVPADSPLAGGPSIFTAMKEQLGLKLESGSAPIEFLVADHAEQPTGN